MAIYKYKKETLQYVKIPTEIMFLFIGILITIMVFISFLILENVIKVKYISAETKAIVLREVNKENEFTPNNLKKYLLELNIKYPHIAMAQATIETGNFTSLVFKENKNLFGMKCATRRPSTNKGLNNNHAYYNDWKESVQDYAMFVAAYLNDIHSESEYFEYLKQNYAEDPNYVTKLKAIIKQNNLLK